MGFQNSNSNCLANVLAKENTIVVFCWRISSASPCFGVCHFLFTYGVVGSYKRIIERHFTHGVWEKTHPERVSEAKENGMLLQGNFQGLGTPQTWGPPIPILLSYLYPQESLGSMGMVGEACGKGVPGIPEEIPNYFGQNREILQHNLINVIVTRFNHFHVAQFWGIQNRWCFFHLGQSQKLNWKKEQRGIQQSCTILITGNWQTTGWCEPPPNQLLICSSGIGFLHPKFSWEPI